MCVLPFISKDGLWAASGPKTSFRGKKEFCRVKYLRRVQKYNSRIFKKCTEKGRRGLRVSSEYSRKCKEQNFDQTSRSNHTQGGKVRNRLTPEWNVFQFHTPCVLKNASVLLPPTHTHAHTQSVVGHSPLHYILLSESDSRWDEAPQQHLSQNFSRGDTVSRGGGAVVITTRRRFDFDTYQSNSLILISPPATV